MFLFPSPHRSRPFFVRYALCHWPMARSRERNTNHSWLVGCNKHPPAEPHTRLKTIETNNIGVAVYCRWQTRAGFMPQPMYPCAVGLFHVSKKKGTVLSTEGCFEITRSPMLRLCETVIASRYAGPGGKADCYLQGSQCASGQGCDVMRCDAVQFSML